MPVPFAELTMLGVICALVCLIVFGLVYIQTREARSAESADGGRYVSRSHAFHLVGAEFNTMLVAPTQVEQQPLEDASSGVYGQDFTEDMLGQVVFTPIQMKRLLVYRDAYRRGYFQPDPLLPRRLAFARWLYQQGKISG